MKVVTMWVADDGSQFTTEYDCVKHEKASEFRNFVRENCGSDYDVEYDIEFITVDNVCQFLVQNRTKLICMLQDMNFVK